MTVRRLLGSTLALLLAGLCSTCSSSPAGSGPPDQETSLAAPSEAPATSRTPTMPDGVQVLGRRSFGSLATVSDNGTATVIYRSLGGTYSRQARPDGDWGVPRRIPGASGSTYLLAARAAHGGAVTVIWWRDLYSRHVGQVYAAELAPRGAWSTRQIARTPGGERASTLPAAALSETGGAVVVWGGGGPTMAVYRTPGGNWTQPTRVSGAVPGSVDATISQDGVATLALPHTGQDKVVLIQRTPTGWGPPVDLMIPRLSPWGGTDVDAIRGADVVLAWSASAADRRGRLVGVGHYVDRTWRRHLVQPPQKRGVDTVMVDATPDGSSRVAWSLGPFEAATQLTAASVTPGGSVQGQLVASEAGPISQVELSRGSSGDGVLAWTEAEPQRVRLTHWVESEARWLPGQTLTETSRSDALGTLAAAGNHLASVVVWDGARHGGVAGGTTAWHSTPPR